MSSYGVSNLGTGSFEIHRIHLTESTPEGIVTALKEAVKDLKTDEALVQFEVSCPGDKTMLARKLLALQDVSGAYVFPGGGFRVTIYNPKKFN